MVFGFKFIFYNIEIDRYFLKKRDLFPPPPPPPRLKLNSEGLILVMQALHIYEFKF